MGWGEFDCRQPSCSCLGFSSWHVLRRPTVMGMWECWGGDQIHPKKWWQRLHVPLLLTNFMSFFCAKFKLLMSSKGLKNINMCMDESGVMRNFDVSLGSHCESRLDLINKRCTSGGNIDCFWMNFVRPFWDISQMLPTSAEKDGILMDVSVTEALPGSNCVVMQKVADARGDGGVIFLGSLLTQTCQRKPWALSVPGSFLGFGERKFLDKVVGRLWIGWIIELPNEFYLQHTALTVDDITWACCGLLVNHEQNLQKSLLKIILRFHHVVSGIATSLTAVALPEAITECLARHHRELQRDLSDSIQVFFGSKEAPNLSQLGEFWFEAIGLQSVIYRPDTPWEFSSNFQFVRISSVSPVLLRAAPLFQVLPAPLTVPTLSTPITDFGEVQARRILGPWDERPGSLKSEIWAIVSFVTAFLLSFLWHLPLQNGLEVTQKQFKKKHFMGIGIIRYVGVCGLRFAYKVFWIHFLFGAYTTSMEISWTSKLHLTGEVATPSETMEIHRVSCLLVMISWSWCWCLRKQSVNEWNLLIYLYLEWMAGHVSRIY